VFGDECLPRARRTFEDQLALFLEQLIDFA